MDQTTTLPTMPKQTRPRMVVMSFRLPVEVKEKFIARAEREGLNPTEVVRDLATEWAEEES